MSKKNDRANKEKNYEGEIEKTEEEERTSEMQFINHGGRWELRDKVGRIVWDVPHFLQNIQYILKIITLLNFTYIYSKKTRESIKITTTKSS